MNDEMKTHHVAILGGGAIGKVHTYAYATLPFYSDPVPLNGKVKWVVNSRQETAEAAAAMIPGARGMTDWRRAVEDPEVEIVHICTPNDLHFDQLAAVIAAGKHVYCEKPVTATHAEAQKLAALLPDYRGVSHMTLNYRYFEAMLLMKRLVADGRLGRILEFRGQYMQDSNVDQTRPDRWRNFARHGGGALMDIGTHILDMAEWMLGPMRCISALSTRPFTPVEDTQRADDAVSMLWRTEAGAVGTIQVSKIAFGCENDLALEIYGTRGAVRFHGMTPHFLELCETQADLPASVATKSWNRIAVGNRYSPPDTQFPGAKHATGWARSHCACLADFLRAVAAGKPSPMNVTLSRGIHLMQMVHEAQNLACETH